VDRFKTLTVEIDMSTNTSVGDIPFRTVVLGDLTFLAPVRILPYLTDGKGRPAPLEDAQGHYIYALPGGMYLMHDNSVFDPKSSVLG
jgi:hypothetical protein